MMKYLLIMSFFLMSVASSNAQIASFTCVGTLSQSNDKRTEIFTKIDLNMKTRKGCMVYSPSRRGLHCFDFAMDDNHYTLLNGYKKPEEAMDENNMSQGFFMNNTFDSSINRKTAKMEAGGTLSHLTTNRIVVSFSLKSTCEKSKYNGLFIENKL